MEYSDGLFCYKSSVFWLHHVSKQEIIFRKDSDIMGPDKQTFMSIKFGRDFPRPDLGPNNSPFPIQK